MIDVIKANYVTKVIVADGEKDWVKLAADDLANDLCRVRGIEANAKAVIGDWEQRQIFIGTVSNKNASILLEKDIPIPNKKEGFTIAVSDEDICILGYDDFGTMWGIYEFAEKFLGILPCYRFHGILPEAMQTLSLEPMIIEDAPKTSGFRGWFINDEDFLCAFKGGGGERKIDFPFYHTTIHPDIMDMILETALRLKMNLIIPSSFIDIDNPPEEAIVEACAKRGLYISQHHIEPLGVSSFAAERYIREHGLEGKNSFVTNRKVMEEIWRYYAKKWAKYPRVIYQLGLRGKGDNPVWKMDSAVDSSVEAAGKLISDAIETQYNIAKEATGGNFLSSTTLWMESAELLNKGSLTVPKDTYCIFCDIGFHYMWGDDFYSVKRQEQQKYGVYYHAGYNPGQHCCEALNPKKMLYCMKAAYESQIDYAIVNVANIREFIPSVTCFSKITWNGGEIQDADALLEEYFTDIFDEKGTDIFHLYQEYVESYVEEPEETLKKACEHRRFDYHEYHDLPFKNFVLCDGLLYWLMRRVVREDERGIVSFENFTTIKSDTIFFDAADSFEVIAHKAEKIEGLSVEQRRCLENTLILYCYNMAANYRAAHYLYMGVMTRESCKEKSVRYLQQAIDELEEFLIKRNSVDLGYLQGWYNGDLKLNIPAMIEFIRKWQ